MPCLSPSHTRLLLLALCCLGWLCTLLPTPPTQPTRHVAPGVQPPAPLDAGTPPAVRPWHRYTPPLAAAWLERLEREEAGLQARFASQGTAPARPGTFEASRPYLLWMLEQWSEEHALSAAAPLGTHPPDPEWQILPHSTDNAVWCVYGSLRGPTRGSAANQSFAYGGKYGIEEAGREACDLHTMALPSAGTHDLFVWGQTLEHLQDASLGMARVAAHLAPGGWHVTTAPTHNVPHAEPFLYFLHTPPGLALLSAAAGMPPTALGYYGGPSFNAASHTMSFSRRAIPGNQLTERFWPGELPGPVPMELRGAAQVLLLSRKHRRAAAAVDVKAYAATRPRLLNGSEVWGAWEAWVRGRWGWRPQAGSVAALRLAAGGAGAGAGQGGCAAGALGVGDFLGLVGLMEGLQSTSSTGAGGGGEWVVVGDQPACFCAAARAGLAAAGSAFSGSCRAVDPWQLPSLHSRPSLLMLGDVLEYVEDPVQLVCQAAQAVAPGGRVWLGARSVVPRDPYASGRLMLRSISPTALVVMLQRCQGVSVVDAGHWGGREAITRWVVEEGALGASFDSVLGQGEVPASEWVTNIHGWALGVVE